MRGTDNEKSVKTVLKAAAKAASGNYAGAAMDVLRDEGTRKTIAILLVLAILIAPLALCAGIIAAKELLDAADERFYEAYGRFASFFKGLWAILAGDDDEDEAADKVIRAIQDETAGREDNPNEDDLLWNVMVGIVFPVAVIALAVCAVKMLWGGQKAAEEAKSTALRIIAGVCVVLMAPELISWLLD